MEITILGCGASSGVPVIGCKCSVCKSSNIRNKRLRSSILISENSTNILIDTGPDLRMQALTNNIDKVEAILYTHAHADHINGIDDVRSFNYNKNDVIPIYGNSDTIKTLEERFQYIFKEVDKNFKWYRAALKSNIVEIGEKISICDINIEVFEQIHGKIQSLGFKINEKLAYSTDLSDLPKKSLEVLKDIDIWIVDCLSEDPSPGHTYLRQVLEWVKKIKAKKVFLTHLNHTMEYNKIQNKLPPNIYVAYDNMKITI